MRTLRTTNSTRAFPVLWSCAAAMIIAIGAIMGAPAVATADEPPVAYVSFGTDGITFNPVQDFESLVVTVSGGDVTVTRTLDGSTSAVFDIFDDAGNVFPDGSYNYEVRAVVIGAVTREDDGGGGPASGAGQVQSGSFGIDAGWLVDPDAVETGGVAASGVTTADIVHNDDVIIDGSLCVGFDCVNGENFGFDTIRLKENNTRINFFDTSNTASFPTRNWQLRANSSSNGGQSAFFIMDQGNNGSSEGGTAVFGVTAGAPANALFVDDEGLLGVKTGTPVVEVHAVDGNTPALRLQQDGSDGFTPQTWDMAGNETNFFVRDVTNGSALPFRIFPGSPQNAIVIDNPAGDVGMGTSSPAAALDIVRTTGSPAVLLRLSNNQRGQLEFTNTNTANQTWRNSNSNGGNFEINDTDAVNGAGGGLELQLQSDGTLVISGNITEGSSRLGKENFSAIDGQALLARLEALPITSWNYKTDPPDERHIGPVAEDFRAAFGLGMDDKHIAPLDTAGVALAAIKAQQAIIREKDAQISALQERMSVLEGMVADLVEAREAKSGVILER